MELELCLSLSNSSPKIPILKELDLISYVNCEAKQFCDDNSALSSQSSVNGDSEEGENDGLSSKNGERKRGFGEVESSVFARTLPLFLWDKDPNEQDKEPNKRVCNSTVLSINRNEGEAIVGWPPVKSYRKNFCHQEEAPHRRRESLPAVENGGSSGGRRNMFVKVQMEGFMITRKIDLKLHQSYESLTCSLLTMFGKGHDSVGDYKLTYQDKEGDWLLAGDVPWRTFIQSVQRLKLLIRDD